MLFRDWPDLVVAARCGSPLVVGVGDGEHFVASDAHNVGRRPPGLAEARAVLETRWGLEIAVRLTDETPRAVIEDRPLEEVF